MAWNPVSSSAPVGSFGLLHLDHRRKEIADVLGQLRVAFGVFLERGAFAAPETIRELLGQSIEQVVLSRFRIDIATVLSPRDRFICHHRGGSARNGSSGKTRSSSMASASRRQSPRLVIRGPFWSLHRVPQAAQGGSGLVGLTEAVLRQGQKGQVCRARAIGETALIRSAWSAWPRPHGTVPRGTGPCPGWSDNSPSSRDEPAGGFRLPAGPGDTPRSPAPGWLERPADWPASRRRACSGHDLRQRQGLLDAPAR